MYISNVLLCVFVFSVSEISCELFSRRRCFDCVSILSCKSGIDFARRVRQGTASRQTLIDAICSTDSKDDRIPKVCCSDFSKGNPTDNFDEIPDPIETHPNIGLLPTSCGDIEGSRIINGRTPKLYELPWMALIDGFNRRNEKELHCGGSIISSRYILTTASCVTDGNGLRKIAGVRVGVFNTSRNIDCQGDYDNMICESKIQDIDVEEIIPHESFTRRPPMTGDIALLRLKEDINMTNNAAPICLPVYRDLRNTSLAGRNATIAACGVKDNIAEYSTLLKAEVPILTNDACSAYYNRTTFSTKAELDRYIHQRNLAMEKIICADDMVKDTCGGAGGSPLILESDYNNQVRLVQFGIVSFGSKGCDSHLPGVYTDVTKYMDWILDNIGA